MDENFEAAQQIAEKFLAERNGDSQHAIIAIGHCHIDCAWLWPYAETVRKCARSWSSVLRLMERYPNFKFVCSQAQQLEWMKRFYPSLFNRIKHFVAKGQFVLVGGTWVEMDGLMPSGESFIRQFLYGQKFFHENFGFRCSEFWLPDTFGYSAQLPQIARHCGISRFVTQKLSWSLVNSFPHHNFIWEGIDGSELLTHFPPGNTYEMKMEVEELVRTVNNLKDKGRVQQSLFLYGFGDGGGGPTEEMIERAKRLKDVDGLPKVQLSTLNDFFTRLESQKKNLCRWVGELYLELHNGTYTTQAAIKRHNRKRENDFQRLEFLSAVLYSVTRSDSDYPRGSFTAMWQTLLLNQFHDVLPGTSIRRAIEETLEMLSDLEMEQKKCLKSTMSKLFGEPGNQETIVVNTLSWPRTDIIAVPEESEPLIVSVPSFGVAAVAPIDYSDVSFERSDNLFILQNVFFRATLNERGQVLSLKLNSPQQQELIDQTKVANRFVIYDDIPLYWDAWDVMDYHLETRREQNEIINPLKLLSQSSKRIVLGCKLKIGLNSELELKVIIDACHPFLTFTVKADWKENHKFLKVEFPANVLSREATYEIQFGHLRRPTHRNTSWDSARFEVCGHKWADICEHDLGLAVLNDSKYGYSADQNVLYLSLLRSSKSPDEIADMGEHEFRYAMMPHAGTFQDAGVIERAYEFNNQLLLHRFDPSAKALIELKKAISWFSVDVAGVIVESVKRAEEEENCLLLRTYEAYGRKITATISSTLKVVKVTRVSGLEDSPVELKWENYGVTVHYTPFKIISLLLYI